MLESVTTYINVPVPAKSEGDGVKLNGPLALTTAVPLVDAPTCVNINGITPPTTLLSNVPVKVVPRQAVNDGLIITALVFGVMLTVAKSVQPLASVTSYVNAQVPVNVEEGAVKL